MGWMRDDLTGLRTVVCRSFDQIVAEGTHRLGPPETFPDIASFAFRVPPFHFLLLFLQSPDVPVSSFFVVFFSVPQAYCENDCLPKKPSHYKTQEFNASSS